MEVRRNDGGVRGEAPARGRFYITVTSLNSARLGLYVDSLIVWNAVYSKFPDGTQSDTVALQVISLRYFEELEEDCVLL